MTYSREGAGMHWGGAHAVSVKFCFLRDVGDTQVFIMLFFIPLSMPNICPNLLFKYRFKKCRLLIHEYEKQE